MLRCSTGARNTPAVCRHCCHWRWSAVAAVSIRDLDDQVRERLRVRAAQHGRSMGAEIRAILTAAVSEPASTGLARALLARFGALGGVDLDLPPRTATPSAANFDS